MRSIYNYVARNLMEGYDATWLQLRRAVETAHVAVDSVDLWHMEGYGTARDYVPSASPVSEQMDALRRGISWSEPTEATP